MSIKRVSKFPIGRAILNLRVKLIYRVDVYIMLTLKHQQTITLIVSF